MRDSIKSRSALIRKFLCFILIAAFSLVPVVATMESAQAQEKRSLFDKLFGRKKTSDKDNKKTSDKDSKTSPKKASKTKKSANIKTAAATAKPALPKSPTAKRILVVGDFIASHIGDGLEALYADNPDLVVIKQIEAASGMVRDDYYNWPAKIDEALTTNKPDVILIALGANDRQSLRFDGQSFDFGNELWEKHYRARLKNFMQNPNMPLQAWLGLPPFQKTQLNAAALTLNSYLEEEASKIEAHFIDIWQGFVDDKNSFNFSGYDPQGQFVRLRTSDGINFTVAGKLKLAFYADIAIKKLLHDVRENEVINEPQEIAQDVNLPAATSAAPQQVNVKYIAPQPLMLVPEHEPQLLQTAPPLNPSLARTISPQIGRADYFFND